MGSSSHMSVVLEARNVSKSYGHVRAVTNANLVIHESEVLALVGDNGAGKSTLAKILAGSVIPDRGSLHYAGSETRVTSTRDVQRLGVEVVYQDLAVCPDLPVVENVFLGRELYIGGLRGKLHFVSRKAMAEQTQAALEAVGTTVKSVTDPVRDLSGGQRQAVAIARAVMWARLAIIMDEPTAALGTKQKDRTNGMIVEAARRGLAVLVISHDIPNMLEVADRMAVMRHGTIVDDRPTSEATIESLVALMLGAAGNREGDAAGDQADEDFRSA
jgi:simple sugar transport system ATP-binding protein